MGFDPFDREDPRGWDLERRSEQIESFNHPSHLPRREEGTERRHRTRGLIREHLKGIRRLLEEGTSNR